MNNMPFTTVGEESDYTRWRPKGMKPEMARPTLARKIAAIALTLWKKKERFDAEHLKPQAA